MSKKHDKDFLMSRKYATFVANEYAKRIEKAIEYIKQSIDNSQPFYEYLFGDENGKVENLDKLLNILQGEDKDDTNSR